MPNIFISYRRDDSSDVTGRIFDKLKAKFGAGHLFRDIDSIPLGTDFHRVIADAVGRCDVLLAIIGDDWLTIADGNGGRRIDDPMDFVHTEIRAALDRGIPVIPVLVERAAMPKAASLPEPLRPLASRNGIPVRSDPDFHNDMELLCGKLKPGRLRWQRVAPAAALLVIMALGAYFTLSRLTPDPGPPVPPVLPLPQPSPPIAPDRPSPESDQRNAPVQAPDKFGKLYFLGIGIDSYQSKDGRLPVLRFAVSDIKRLADTLTGCNPASRAIEVMPLLLNENATRTRVVEAIGSLRSKLKTKDLGIIAYAGVELFEPESTTKPKKPASFYILPYDCDLKRPKETAISATDIFGVMPNSRGQVVFWLDTCNSGQLALDMERVNPTIITFASSAAGEICVEHESVGGGAFTTALVRGLKGEANSNQDGIVTLDELAPFASSTTRSLATELREKQNPVIEGDLPPLPVTAPGKGDK